MTPLARPLFIGTGFVALVLAAGFFLQLPWATGAWPWPAGRLAHIFLASILAAAALPVLWIGISGELAAAAGGALNLSVAYAGVAFHALGQGGSADASAAGRFGLVCAVVSVVCAGLFLWSRRLPFQDRRPVPGYIRLSFVLFAVILVSVGAKMVWQGAQLFPWPLTEAHTAVYGWIFLGAACYFLYSIAIPVAGTTTGQLLGFLAYDLVLIVPFAQHFDKVTPALRINLWVYLAVLVFSALLALHALGLHRATRLWRIEQHGAHAVIQ
jgi:hypothetical protein